MGDKGGYEERLLFLCDLLRGTADTIPGGQLLLLPEVADALRRVPYVDFVLLAERLEPRGVLLFVLWQLLVPQDEQRLVVLAEEDTLLLLLS